MQETTQTLQADDVSLSQDLTAKWGPDAPKGAKAVFGRIIKEGANVPLFLGQTLVNALRDLGYNDTTSAVCEHVDNGIQWGAKEVRVYFNESRRRASKKIDVLVLDTGPGMAPNVLRAACAFGGSMCYDNRSGLGRYGMGMKAAALSLAPAFEIYSWQEKGAFYSMTLDINVIGDDRANVVTLPEATFSEKLPTEIEQILIATMSYPKNPAETQTVLAENVGTLYDRLGRSGTLIYIPACDRTSRTVKTLVDKATQGMSTIYRRQLARGVRIYVNNRQVQPFDPTYWMENAWHSRVEEITEKRSRLIRSWDIEVPVEEGSEKVKIVKARLFLLPLDDWYVKDRRVLKDLRVFDRAVISFMRSEREVDRDHMHAIVGKFHPVDNWWRLEIEFPAELDEAFGVAVNKQGVRPKDYVSSLIKANIREDLAHVRATIAKHNATRAAGGGKSQSTEAERRATEADPLQPALLPNQPEPRNDEEQATLERNLRDLAIHYRNDRETNDEAFERIKRSRYLTTFKHDEDAAFYRVDYQLGKVILTINTAHPFFQKVYAPLKALALRTTPLGGSSEADDMDDERTSNSNFNEVLVGLQLLLLSLGRTQSQMLANDPDGAQKKIFDSLRLQWSINLSTQLGIE